MLSGITARIRGGPRDQWWWGGVKASTSADCLVCFPQTLQVAAKERMRATHVGKHSFVHDYARPPGQY